MYISPDLVKELRLKSGIGIMECKNALIIAKGNMQEAILILKNNGKIKAENKIKDIALRGIIFTYIKNQYYSYILELNCETDFVEHHPDFLKFASEILHTAHKDCIQDILYLRRIFDEKRVMLISKFGENIIIRRFNILIGNYVTTYVHRNKIGVLVRSNKIYKDIINKVAMHIAANNPDYISKIEVPDVVIEKEKQLQLGIAIRTGKPLSIAKKIVNGRLEKFINSICLLEQNCVFDVSKKIKEFLSQNDIHILKFIRFELGEII